MTATAWAPLVVLAVVLAPLGLARARGWKLGVAEVAAAIALSAAVALWAPMVTAGRLDSTWYPSDFHEYCAGAERWRHGPSLWWSGNRSRLVVYLPYTLASSLGIIDGLTLGAIISVGVLAFASYLWARAFADAAVALAAAALVLAFVPLAILARTPTIYPETAAILALGAACAAHGLSRGNLVSLLAGGCGAALMALVDVRGIVWMLPFTGGLLLRAVIATPRWIPVRVALVLLPLWASWNVAGWALGPYIQPLEYRGDVWRLLLENGIFTEVPYVTQGKNGFVWGRSDLPTLLSTLQWMATSTQVAPAKWYQTWAIQNGYRAFVQPWLWPLGLCLAAVVVANLRRGWVLWGLFCTILPFGAQLYSSVAMVSFDLRFLGISWPAGVIVLALAIDAPGRLWRAWRPEGLGDRWGLARATLAVLGAVAMVLGWVPSAFGPHSAWQSRVGSGGEVERYLAAAEDDTGEIDRYDPNAPERTMCHDGLRRDFAAGLRPRVIPAPPMPKNTLAFPK
ncbi:MAG: hypothetical protein FJ102_08965 [Deltaproteobacteria bacterium]|nr:hypothetical protein [Deltaproteobacteria bacterium]